MGVAVICYFLPLIFIILYIDWKRRCCSSLHQWNPHRFLLSVLWRICGCGSGESGCSSCGCCKACARELDGQEARQRGIFDAVKEMIPLDLLLGTEMSSNHIQYSSIAIKSHPFPVCGPRSCHIFNHTVCMHEIFSLGKGRTKIQQLQYL